MMSTEKESKNTTKEQDADDGMQAFMRGTTYLMTSLKAVNDRLGELEKASELRVRDIENLRAFIISVHHHLMAHDDFVRNPNFLQGVHNASYEIVISKCMPEIWKLEANISTLSSNFEQLNIDHGQKSKGEVKNLYNEVEDLLIRLAALGNDKIHHIEIIGDSGKRYPSGTPKRKLITEQELSKGKGPQHLPLPKSWSADTDTTTINKNFAQIVKMINDIVLPRIDEVEERMDSRLDHIEKRVEVLNSLFRAIYEDAKSKKTISATNSSQDESIDKNTTCEAESTTPVTCVVQKQDEVDSKAPQGAVVETIATGSQTCTVTLQKTESGEHVGKEHVTIIQETKEVPKRKPKKSYHTGAAAGRAAYKRAQPK